MTEDIANFSSPSLSQLHTPGRPRQVPVFSSLPQTTLGPISTGLERLDRALVPQPSPIPPSSALRTSSQVAPTSSPSYQPRWSQLGPPSLNIGGIGAARLSAGIRRREVTDIVGPKGVGKTSLAMSVAANVLASGQSVIWIDTAGPICSTRLENMVRRRQNTLPNYQSYRDDDVLKNLLHFQPTSIAHLMALLSHPPPGFPPKNTGLIVLDSISCLFGAEFRPRMPDPVTGITYSSTPNGNRKDGSNPAGREDRDSKLRWKVIGEIASSLKRLAVLSECAAITTNEMVTRFRPPLPPVLHEAVSGFTWDAGVATRILIYWRWLPASVWEALRMKRVRIAEVVKAAGTACADRNSERIVPFVINDGGISEFTHVRVRLHSDRGTPRHQMMKKRKIDEPTTDQVGIRQRVEPQGEAAGEQSYDEWPGMEAEIVADILSEAASSDTDEGMEGDDANGNEDKGNKVDEVADSDADDDEDFQSLLEEVELD